MTIAGVRISVAVFVDSTDYECCLGPLLDRPVGALRAGPDFGGALRGAGEGGGEGDAHVEVEEGTCRWIGEGVEDHGALTVRG